MRRHVRRNETFVLALSCGYKASAEQFDPRELVELAVHAEACGFDSVMVSDHFQPWRHHDGHAPFSIALLAAMAERTRRVRIGTSVLTPSFRYHPAIVAQAFATLERLAPGRVILGVGTGEALNELPVMAVDWPGFKERFGRLREAIELIRRLWREDFVTHEGPHFRTRNATIYDKPSGRLPIYVAASGAQAARLAGELGDGFICTSGKPPELYRDTLIPALEQGARSAGRAPDALPRMIELKVSFDRDPRRALEDTRIWAALALPAEAKMSIHDPREMEQLAAELPLERAASRWIVSADPAAQVAAIEPYLRLGFHELVFHAPGTDQRRFLDLYAQQVVPRLRELAVGNGVATIAPTRIAASRLAPG